MRATKGYVAGVGTTGALIGAIACAFAALSAVVAVHGLPLRLLAPGVATLDRRGEASPATPLGGLLDGFVAAWGSGAGGVVTHAGSQLGGTLQGTTAQLGGALGQASPAAGQLVTQAGQTAGGLVAGATGAAGQAVSGAGAVVGGLLGGRSGGSAGTAG